MFIRSHETNLFTQQCSLCRRPKSNYETRCLVYILRTKQSERQAVTCVVCKNSITFEKENQLTCIKGSAPHVFVYSVALLLKYCSYQTMLLLRLLTSDALPQWFGLSKKVVNSVRVSRSINGVDIPEIERIHENWNISPVREIKASYHSSQWEWKEEFTQEDYIRSFSFVVSLADIFRLPVE